MNSFLVLTYVVMKAILIDPSTLLPPAFPSTCDSQGAASAPSPAAPSVPSIPGCHADAARLEEEYVHRVYDAIASHFSSTRHTPWPRVCQFLASLPAGSVLADVGCGNGKYLGVNPEVVAVSVIMLYYVCDTLALPAGKFPFSLHFYCHWVLDHHHREIPHSYFMCS